MTDFTPEYICEQLVRVGKLGRVSRGGKIYYSPALGSDIESTAEQAIADGNVFAAALKAVKALEPSAQITLASNGALVWKRNPAHMSQAHYPIAEAAPFDDSIVAGTTACAMALKELEE